MNTPYDVLGVPEHADDNAIRAAFRRTAKVHHPDVNAGDPEAGQRLKEAIAAHDFLMNPAKRAAYDQYLRLHRQQRARRLLATGLASAGVASGMALAVAIWLARPHIVSTAPEPSVTVLVPSPAADKEKSRAAAPVPVPEPSFLALEPGLAADEKKPSVASVPAPEPSTFDLDPNPAADQKVATAKRGVPAEVAEHTTAPVPSTPPGVSSLAGEWEQLARGGDATAIWAFARRHAEAPEAELARSWLMLLIDATDDVVLLDSLRVADGTLAEQAQHRRHQLEAAATIAARNEQQVPTTIAANDGDPEDVAPQDAAGYLKRGLRRLREANFDGAIADFDAAIGLEPGNGPAHRHRASAWGAKGNRERALADFELAIRIDPADPALFRERGMFWRRNGELDLALVDFDHAIRLGFSDAEAYNQRGLVWHDKGHYERAIADFSRAIKIDPNLVAAYVNRGNALRDKGDLASSEADLAQATIIGAPRP
jgi:tetratricopeptide (TPR) repeat protein